jgi:hypothetical protein
MPALQELDVTESSFLTTGAESMTTDITGTTPSLYEKDYLAWIEATADAIRQGNLNAVDWDNLLEEIEDMGRRERKSFKSNLIVVLLHLLKWQFQPQYRSNSWKGSIVEHRRRILEALEESPSLQPFFEEILSRAYQDAIDQAEAETGLPRDTFPATCPYSEVEIIEKGFLP